MTPEELLAEWTEGESGMRPARLQRVRDDLMEATGIYVPHRRSELPGWIDAQKSHVTRKLKEAVEEDTEDKSA